MGGGGRKGGKDPNGNKGKQKYVGLFTDELEAARGGHLRRDRLAGLSDRRDQ